MNKYGLLGFPLGHTMSPPIHKRLFEFEGVTDFDYSLFEISEEDMALIDKVEGCGWSGLYPGGVR